MSNKAFEIGRHPVLAAGRIHDTAGTPAWVGTHPGFANTITKNGTGNYQLAPNIDLTQQSVVILATTPTDRDLVEVVRTSGSSLQVLVFTDAGVANEGDVDIAILAV